MPPWQLYSRGGCPASDRSSATTRTRFKRSATAGAAKEESPSALGGSLLIITASRIIRCSLHDLTEQGSGHSRTRQQYSEDGEARNIFAVPLWNDGFPPEAYRGGRWPDQLPRGSSPGVVPTDECPGGRSHDRSPPSLAALGALPQGLLIFGGEKRTSQAGFHGSHISGWRPPLGPGQHDAHAHDGQEHEPYRQEDSHGFTVSLQSSHDMVEQAGRRSTYRPSRGEIPGAAVVDPGPGRTTIRCPRFAWNDVHLPMGATPMVMERRTTSRHVPTPGQYAGLPLPVAWPLIASVRPTRQAREVADESPSNCCQYPDF